MDEIDKLLEKSTDRLQAACQLHNSGFFEDSVSRSYYVMYYAARERVMCFSITVAPWETVATAALIPMV